MPIPLNKAVNDTSLAKGIFIERYLDPFRPFLLDQSISEICVNAPHEVWVERRSSPIMEKIEVKEINHELLHRLATQIAASTSQSINQETPLLSAALPTGERIQVILPPVSRFGAALSIRKQIISDLTLDDIERSGGFSDINFAIGSDQEPDNNELYELHREREFKEFIRLAVRKRKNILISGGTSSGKTTLLSSILREIDKNERIITIEDTPEIHLHHENHLSLIASKGDQSSSKASVQDLLEASLRMRPDRILLGELRGKEAYTFLRAINTGHPGSITTIHADTPKGAFEQICLMVMQSGLRLTHEQIRDYIGSIIDVVIQLKRVGGKRIISEVWLPHGRA